MARRDEYHLIGGPSDSAIPCGLTHPRAPSENLRSRFRDPNITRRWAFGFTLISLLTVISTGSIGFRWGINVQKTREGHVSWLTPPGSVHTVFEYQKPFALRPSNESTALWASLFPRGGGFVTHPELSPEPKCVAVYHQLHCLDAIRSGYWAAIDGIEPSHHARPSHVRHCIDYLRQSLMCHADTNLEAINQTLAGVTGFGSEKQCRDYGRVTAWADQWRTRERDEELQK